MIDLAERLFRRSHLQSAGTLTAGRIIETLRGRESKSGVRVNVDTSLRISPVWQAVSLLSGDTAKIDFNTWRRLQPRGREMAIDHPTFGLLHGSIGDYTSNIWLQAIMANALLYGNGYSRIKLAGGRPSKLEFIPSRYVVPTELDDRTLIYIVMRPPSFEEERIFPFEMFHLRGLLIDIAGGLSVVDYAKDTIGRQIARGDYGDEFFSNAAVPRGWFKHPGEMSKAAQDRFLEAVEKRHSGQGNRHRIGIIEEGMDWVQLGISPEDALLVEQLKFGTKEVAAIFNLPPHKLGDDSRVAFNSLEEENKSYHDASLGTWLKRLECEADDKLFTQDEKIARTYFTQFDRDQLFRPDFKTRMEGHSKVVLAGIRLVNEVREAEGWNPVEGGDERLIPVNVKAGIDDEPKDEDGNDIPPDEQDDEQANEQRAKIEKLLQRSIKRMHDRLCSYVHRWGIKKGELPRALELLEEKHSSVLADEFGAYFDDDRSLPILAAAKKRWLAAANCMPDEVETSLQTANDLLLTDMEAICNGREHAHT